MKDRLVFRPLFLAMLWHECPHYGHWVPSLWASIARTEGHQCPIKGALQNYVALQNYAALWLFLISIDALTHKMLDFADVFSKIVVLFSVNVILGWYFLLFFLRSVNTIMCQFINTLSRIFLQKMIQWHFICEKLFTCVDVFNGLCK